jgi:hypothetical protein
MVNDTKDGFYSFAIKGKEYEVFFAEDKHVELYEVQNPGKTGFIFSDLKQLNLFINNMTDIAEIELSKED